MRISNSLRRTVKAVAGAVLGDRDTFRVEALSAVVEIARKSATESSTMPRDEEFNVEAILDVRLQGTAPQYLIKWEDYE